jgi:two-component system sensor histidine kinase EvgS
VIDNGLGISEEEQARLFQPHYRPLDSNQNKDKPSNGMGLYISKKIMVCLGGTMEVKSTPGVKTQFKIYFEAQKIDFDPNVSVYSLLMIFIEEERAYTLFLETR